MQSKYRLIKNLKLIKIYLNIFKFESNEKKIWWKFEFKTFGLKFDKKVKEKKIEFKNECKLNRIKSNWIPDQLT
jgi:hypothetical protein